MQFGKLLTMLVSSIDLMGGRVVQLRNGKDMLLERDDADSLIADFDKYGEVAVIDLDAAMGKADEKGETQNTVLLKSLLRRGNVRVGGGIRTVKKAKELISLGAEKVIIGSAAWAPDGMKDGNALNTSFLEDLCNAIGKQRVIISVDSIEGKIAVKGWTETVEVPLIEGAKQAERFCSELLFTCVEKEGCMKGCDIDSIRTLRSSVSCRVVAAGGIDSLEEIVELEKIGCDAQVGVALYMGVVKPSDSFIACLNWSKVGGLIPVIAQSVEGEVLMTGFANEEALRKTFETGRLTFYSRTKQRLWTKGEESGHFLGLVRVRSDCDHDSILATVIPHGGVCHTGSWTCFSGEADAKSNLERLISIIAERFANPRPGSYTATLNSKRVREKIMEEAEELVEADSKANVIWETADLIYFVSVLLHREGVTWQDIYNELDRRHKE